MASASAFTRPAAAVVERARPRALADRASLWVACLGLLAGIAVVLAWITVGPFHVLWAEFAAGCVMVASAATVGGALAWHARRAAIDRERLTHLADLEERARRDEVSGLYGLHHLRERLRDELDHAAAAGRPCAIVSFDLVRFKEINERFGHVAGDAVIGAAGSAIRETVNGDAIAARYAGDQFVVVLPGCDRADAATIAQDIRRAIATASTSATPLNTHLRVDAVYGIAVFPDDATDADSLMAATDRTLWQAKAQQEDYVRRSDERDAQEVFFAIGDAMRKSLDPQETVRNLVAAVGSTLGLDTCTIWLQEGQRFSPSAWYLKDTRIADRFAEIFAAAPMTTEEAHATGFVPTRAMYVDDVHTSSVIPERFRALSPSDSWMIHVPLPPPNEGLLTMTATHAGLAPPTTSLARAIARLAASCIQNADVHARSQRQRDQLAALSGIGGLLFGDGDFEQQLGEVVRRIAEVTRCDMLTLDTGDPRGERPFVRQFAGVAPDGGPVDESLSAAWMNMRPALTQSDIVAFLETATEPMVMDDPVNQVPEIYRDVVAESGTESVVVMPAIWQGEVKGLFYFASYRRNAFDAQDIALMKAIASQIAPALQVAVLREEVEHSYQELKAAHTQALLRLAYAAEARDPYTECHLTRIKALSQAIARRMGIEGDELEAIGYGAIVHDLGKLRIPDSILINPGTLSDEEWKTMKKHPEWGAEIIGGNAFYDLARQVALNHHERWDGSGYPQGLKGDEIPLAARIVSVADVYDALTSARPYKHAWPVERALVELMRMRGKTLCPTAVDTFMALWNDGTVARIDEETADESLEFDFRSLFAA